MSFPGQIFPESVQNPQIKHYWSITRLLIQAQVVSQSQQIPLVKLRKQS